MMLTYLGILYLINALYLTWSTLECGPVNPVVLLFIWLVTPITLPIAVIVDLIRYLFLD